MAKEILRGIMQQKYFGLFFILAIFSGCSHYHLGSKPLPFNTLYIEPVRNTSLAPQVQAPLTAQLRQTFLRNTSLTLASEESADATLSTTVTNYTRSATATREEDTDIGRSFAISATVKCSLTDNKTGKVLFSNRTISASVNASTDGGFQESEYRAMAAITENLSLQIKSLVVSVW